MEKKRMVLNIAGQDFRIASENDEAYMQGLASSVNRRIKQVQEQYPMLSTSRAALLAMLGMADELNKLHSEYADVDRKIAELRNLREGEGNRVQAPVKRPFERAGSKKPVGV